MEFGLLGPVWASADGERLHLGPPMQRLVLAVLLLEANKLVPLHRLVDLSWPLAPPSTARTAIHGRISRLRAALTAAGGPEHDVALLSEGSGYVLRIDPNRVDVHRFTALLTQARAAAADEAAIGYYDQALALWRGRPLDGTASEEIRRQLCGSLEEARLLAMEDRTDAELRLGRHRELVDRLTSQLTEHPLREPIAGQLALALYRSDQSGQALEVIRQTRKRLQDELGIDPGPALAKLELEILHNDVSIAPPAQVQARGTVPAQLPAEAAGFTGRAAEVRRVTEMLSGVAPSTMPIGVISGPAGVGKTALAVHCAHRVADRYPDGQLYLDLRGYDHGRPVRPVDALARFLRAVGVPPGQIPIDQDEASQMYRSSLADRRVLVVLDNASSAEQVRPLLPGTAGCAVLITSREDLRGLTAIEGAQPARLDVLRPSESVALLSRMAGARRVEAASEAAGDLAALCAHLPLALRIVGAHLAVHPDQPLDVYARDLAQGNRLGKLSIPEDPRAAVRAAFELSYARLDPDTAKVFRRLGLIPGPDFTAGAAAAAAGCSAEEATAHLDRLDVTHLVRRYTAERYQFHDLLRLYAYELSEVADEPGERSAAVADLLAYYLYNTDAAGRVLYAHRIRVPIPDPPPGLAITVFDDATAATQWLEAEAPNLTAAIHHAAHTEHRAAACLIADAARGYFPGRTPAVEWLALAETVQAAAVQEEDRRLIVSAEMSLGEANHLHSRYPLAIEHYRRARDLARQADWADGESTALGNLTSVYRESGDLRSATAVATDALAINTRIGNLRKQVIDLVNLGILHAQLGELRRAADFFLQAQAIEQQSSSPYNNGLVLQCLGNVSRLLGDLAGAERYLSEAVTLYRDIKDLAHLASTLDSLAGTYADAGRYGNAVAAATEALDQARQVDGRRTEVAALNTLGTVHYGQGKYRDALGLHDESLQLATPAGVVSAQFEALAGMAAAHSRLDQHAEAEWAANRALAMARTTRHRVLEGQAMSVVADCALARGDAAASIDLAREALAIHRETGYRLGTARTLRTLGHALRQTAGTAAAVPYWQEARALLAEIGVTETGDLDQLLNGL